MSTVNAFLAIKSLTKWKSISTCRVLAWNIGFEDKKIALALSHQMWDGFTSLAPNSPRSLTNHVISTQTFATALNLDSVDGRAIVFCLLDFQASKLLPRKNKKSTVDRRSLGHLTQSASLNPIGVSREHFVIRKPRWRVPCKYCNKCLRAW